MFAYFNRKLILAEMIPHAAEMEEKKEEENSDTEEGELETRDDFAADSMQLSTQDFKQSLEEEHKAEIGISDSHNDRRRRPQFQQVLEDPKVKVFREKVDSMHKIFDKMLIKAKIMMTYYQLACSMDSNVAITMPPIFTAISADISSLTDVDVISSVAWPCGDTASILSPIGLFGGSNTSSRFHYGHKLFITTIGPLGISLAIFLITVVASCFSTDPATIRSRGMSAFLLVCHFVFPNCCSTVMWTFKCDTDFDDPAPVDGYMAQDYSISCDSTLYRHMQIFAAIMILIYPIGVPLLVRIPFQPATHPPISRDRVLACTVLVSPFCQP